MTDIALGLLLVLGCDGPDGVMRVTATRDTGEPVLACAIYGQVKQIACDPHAALTLTVSQDGAVGHLDSTLREAAQ